jgi:starvation-inducible DNA-binding protein
LYVKLHHYHWYVKGTSFFTLHEKFEELYDQAAKHVDELAERLLAIGGKPLSRMQDYLDHATIHEAKDEETAEAMVARLIDDYTIMTEALKAAMAAAEEADDEATSDMLLDIRTELEKHLWMLRAFLG